MTATTQDGVRFYFTDTESSLGGVSSRSEFLRFTDPAPRIVCARGMNADDIPPPWTTAVALIVRALYDGSAYDALAEMSSLSMLMASYRVWIPGQRTART